MKKLFLLACMLLAATVSAYAQACPGGFWGNGQCIGACDTPLVNPNVDLKFYGWSCLGGARYICTDGGVFCYPEYTAWDRAYSQYCGVIVDYGAGECTFPYLGLGQQAPSKRRVPVDELSISLRHPVDLRLFRPVTVQRFWWKHASHKFLL